MIAIAAIHRRLAELQLLADRRGGYDRLTPMEQMDLAHCLRINARLVRRTDELKQLSFIAYQAGDVDWQHEICKEMDDLETRLA